MLHITSTDDVAADIIQCIKFLGLQKSSPNNDND